MELPPCPCVFPSPRLTSPHLTLHPGSRPGLDQGRKLQPAHSPTYSVTQLVTRSNRRVILFFLKSSRHSLLLLLHVACLPALGQSK
ncbi:hypothetical protein BO70DRAFT_20784 [Aspergillus heteromorphus CBS 117.55]|uniref:Uncharacterized protein n=1 Tax=Aspergillus heteromorphus CBS 117.55 TaxID=1448321 RepID=A0A317X3X8_9EURO|nr:uncharacterized protein BO70DRAFT_20784 [Aspergillus heteromorphus CBS 117.55]PWY92881.1 hypothetical protein BO70DRAFT_20784 [Aspergillus heteromorphus CBS 117.55]